jgi:ferritin-like protein
MADYQEGFEKLSEEVRGVHRALKSLMEELDAIDAYHQRAAVSEDSALRGVLAHNRDEELEHAAMLLEWLRRQLPTFDEALRTYLFTNGDLTAIEEVAAASAQPGSLGIGDLKGE